MLSKTALYLHALPFSLLLTPILECELLEVRELIDQYSNASGVLHIVAVNVSYMNE